MLKYVISERNVMSKTNHPFIIKLNYSFQTQTRLFLVLDFCPNGDLCSHINIEQRIDEERTRFYSACILLALQDLHRRNIIFRDLKPDNVLIDEAGFAMLTDFGLAKETVEDQDNNKSFCGSFAYLAPEIIMQSGHGKSVDWYLFGVMIYEMLTGLPPYYEKNRKNIIQNILRAPLRIPKDLTPEAKSLIISVNPFKWLFQAFACLIQMWKRFSGSGNSDLLLDFLGFPLFFSAVLIFSSPCSLKLHLSAFWLIPLVFAFPLSS